METLWTVKVGTKDFSIPQRVDHAWFIHDMVEDNKFFTDVGDILTDLGIAAEELQKAYLASRDGGKSTTQDMYNKEKVLRVRMSIMASYVNIKALLNNNIGAIIITSAGFDIREFKGRPKQTFGVEDMNISGKVLARAEVVKNAAYVWETSTDGQHYAVAATSTISTVVLKDLVPGTQYWIRATPVIGTEKQPQQGPAILFIT